MPCKNLHQKHHMVMGQLFTHSKHKSDIHNCFKWAHTSTKPVKLQVVDRYVCAGHFSLHKLIHTRREAYFFFKKKRLCRTEKIIDSKWCGDINKTEHYHWDKLFKGWGECDKFIVTMYKYGSFALNVRWEEYKCC